MSRATNFLESLPMSTSCESLSRPQAVCQTRVEPVVTGESDSSCELPSVADPFSAEAPVVVISQIVELILKDRRRLDRVARTDSRKVELASRLLAISLASFALYGLAMSVTFSAARQWPRVVSPVEWWNGFDMRPVTFVPTGAPGPQAATRALRLIVAYSFGLIAASGICLPSLYFYGLLSGLRMTMSDVVVHSLKGTAIAAVALIGILPVYSALALGVIVLPVSHQCVAAILTLGLCLPFIGGLWGTRSLFVSFVDLCHTMPADFQAQRACLLRRLILSWCGIYIAVAPLMIVTVWRQLGA
jgi:hypothetical protein